MKVKLHDSMPLSKLLQGFRLDWCAVALKSRVTTGPTQFKQFNFVLRGERGLQVSRAYQINAKVSGTRYMSSKKPVLRYGMCLLQWRRILFKEHMQILVKKQNGETVLLRMHTVESKTAATLAPSSKFYICWGSELIICICISFLWSAKKIPPCITLPPGGVPVEELLCSAYPISVVASMLASNFDQDRRMLKNTTGVARPLGFEWAGKLTTAHFFR